MYFYREFARKVEWVTPGSEALRVFTDTLTAQRKNTLRMLSHGQHTGALENLHSLILAYAPKRLDFDPPGYQARVKLAIIEHNSNTGRALQTGG